MNMLSRRVAKIEAAVIKPPFVPKIIRLLAQPTEDAPAEEWAVFERELAQAKAECDLVIRMVPVKPRLLCATRWLRWRRLEPIFASSSQGLCHLQDGVPGTRTSRRTGLQ